MDRANENEPLERSVELLREFCERLSLNSISIFREDGMFICSSDSSIHQQQGTKYLFEVLDGFQYAFEIGVIRAIMVYDYSNCLIIKPMCLEDWRIVDGWIFAHGSSSELKGIELAKQIWIHVEKHTKEDISSKLKIEKHQLKLRRVFELPKILGPEFELVENASAILDGIEGFVLQNRGEPPWGITTTKSGRKYPDLFWQLEQLDMTIQDSRNAIYVLLRKSPK